MSQTCAGYWDYKDEEDRVPVLKVHSPTEERGVKKWL